MVEYGTPMAGQLLEEWCHQASSDERDWFTAEERFHTCWSWAQFLRDLRKRYGQRESPFKSVIIEGEPGVGKSVVANYIATQLAATYGSTGYSDGTFGWDMVLTPDQMLGGYNHLSKGASIFTDEANQYDRKGRDNSDVQEIRNSLYQVTRKRLIYSLLASANPDRISTGGRSRADEFWEPQKIDVRYSEEARERLQRSGQGRGPRGKNNPANFAFAVLKAKDRPYRPASMFDEAKGRKRNPKMGIPIYRKVLSISWMRKTFPMIASFKDVDIGAALGASRQNVIDIARGKGDSGPGHQGDRIVETVLQLARAFSEGRLIVPPPLAPGKIYQPEYLTATEIRNATTSMLGNQKFSAVLRDNLGLSAKRGKGYELLELYEAVNEAMADLADQMEDDAAAPAGIF